LRLPKFPKFNKKEAEGWRIGMEVSEFFSYLEKFLMQRIEDGWKKEEIMICIEEFAERVFERDNIRRTR